MNAFDQETLTETIKREVDRDELSVIITKSPCVLLKGVKFTTKCVPVSDKCKKCGMCLKPGCPALTKNTDGTISINSTMCNGCGLCKTLCKFDAIKEVGCIMETKNIMIVGVGGQGTLLTSRILGKLALMENYDVKLSEVHGMAQRGGSVVTFVRYGEKVAEPIVEEEEPYSHCLERFRG